MITTSTGSTVNVETDVDGTRLVILDHPDAPEDMRNYEAGRIVEFGGNFGFQPVPFCVGSMGPETLRAIAELIEAAK
jgi:hypothetical protein